MTTPCTVAVPAQIQRGDRACWVLFNAYAREGAPDSATQVGVLRRAREAALAGGVPGLRIAAEISGLVRGRPDGERGLQAYEREVCELFDGPDLTALCLSEGALGAILGRPAVRRCLDLFGFDRGCA